MPEYRFYHPIEVRYGDLDPQGHVNHAKHLTYMEQARLAYIRHLGLWPKTSFLDLGFIIADVHVSYHSAILIHQPVRVGVRVTRLGHKSLTLAYCLEDAGDGKKLASGETVGVAYDYHTQQTIPLPDSWRQRITEFEGLSVPA